MNLFRRPASSHHAKVNAQAPSPVIADGVATLRLYDPIDDWGGDWGVSAKEFAASIDALPDDTAEIRVLINSPGGQVFEGIAILNALRAHPARTVAIVEGIAASSASFIAAGCDELVMMQNSELFIHNAWSVVIGDAADMRSTADDLESYFDRNIASIYAAKSGDTVEHWLAEMNLDKFLTAEEAVESKLADRIEGVGSASDARARFDLSVFDRSARAARSPRANQPPSSTEPGESKQKENVVDNNDTLTAVRDRLGVTDAEASGDVLLAALDQALASSSNPTVPAGTVLIDAGALSDLRADAAAGRDAREEQNGNRRDAIVEAAVNSGRISASSRATWRAQLDENETGVASLLASLPENTIPVAELGGQPAEDSTENAEYYALFPDERPTTKEA